MAAKALWRVNLLAAETALDMFNGSVEKHVARKRRERALQEAADSESTGRPEDES